MAFSGLRKQINKANQVNMNYEYYYLVVYYLMNLTVLKI